MSRLIATAVGFLPCLAQPSRYQPICSRAFSKVSPGEASQPSAMRAARSMAGRALAPIQYSTGWTGRRATCAFSTTKRPCEDTVSEEHTSELQSQFHLVCRLLLEKKK